MRLRNTPAFSLIEMIMVLVVLVALAGMLVPQIDFMRRSADKGTASSVMKSLAENIQMFRTLTRDYPDRWDSLIGSGTTDLYTGLNDPGDYLDTTTLSPEQADSLTNIGIDTLMQHDDADAYRGMPGDSGQDAVATAAGGTVAIIDGTTDQGADIIASIYPGGIPVDVTLVALGFGPQNTALGRTVMSPPAYSGIDPLVFYNRFICVFAVYDDGITINADKRAQLKAVLDSAGDFLNQEIIEFNENALDT